MPTTATNKPFDVTAGLQIQNDHICRWSKVLNVDAYLAVLNEAMRRNALLDEMPTKSGYDVWRGSDIANFVQKLCHELPLPSFK